MKALLLDTVHPSFPQKLIDAGFQTDIFNRFEEFEQSNSIDYQLIVVRSKPQITADIIDRFPLLRCIARAGSGIESIDYIYARNKGVEVIHSPEGNCDAVGEHALGLAISLLKNIGKSWLEVRNKQWNRESNRGEELLGKTVGIIGFGNTGSAFARKLSGMGVTVLAYDKYKKGYGNDFVQETDLNEIFHEADIISFHIPLTKETINYASDNFIASCRKNIILLNTSRGKVVNSESLLKALKSGKIRAAGLDVLDFEDYKFEELSASNDEILNQLLASDKVIITPHIAGITEEVKLRHALVLLEKIKKVFAEM